MHRSEQSVRPLLNVEHTTREGLFIHTQLNDNDIEMSEAPRHPNQVMPLVTMNTPSVMRQSSSDTRTTDSNQRGDKSFQPHSSIPARKRLGWTRCMRGSKCIGGMNWTTETCSYIFSIFALAGLVTTLLVHQSKPLPQWPQLVTINSIISLFSLLMRSLVGVVLAEGITRL
jgi:hypothetical protein